MKTVFGTISGIGCFFIVLIMLIGIPIGIWGARVYFAEEIGRGNAEIQIQSAPNRIVTYNKFFDLCVSVQNAEAALDVAEQQKSSSNPTVAQNAEMNFQANTVTRANGINTYNSDAKKNYTDAQFLASNLPYQLPIDPYIPNSGMRTQCAR